MCLSMWAQFGQFIVGLLVGTWGMWMVDRLYFERRAEQRSAILNRKEQRLHDVRETCATAAAAMDQFANIVKFKIPDADDPALPSLQEYQRAMARLFMLIEDDDFRAACGEVGQQMMFLGDWNNKVSGYDDYQVRLERFTKAGRAWHFAAKRHIDGLESDIEAFLKK